MERSQLSLIAKDLRQKLVFLTGPRQVEKTHLALDLLKKSTNGAYLIVFLRAYLGVKIEWKLIG